MPDNRVPQAMDARGREDNQGTEKGVRLRDVRGSKER